MIKEKVNQFYKEEGVVFETPSLETPEPYFSTAHCDICDSSYGGYRYEVVFLRADFSRIESAVCIDCFEACFMLENGEDHTSLQ